MPKLASFFFIHLPPSSLKQTFPLDCVDNWPPTTWKQNQAEKECTSCKETDTTVLPQPHILCKSALCPPPAWSGSCPYSSCSWLHLKPSSVIFAPDDASSSSSLTSQYCLYLYILVVCCLFSLISVVQDPNFPSVSGAPCLLIAESIWTQTMMPLRDLLSIFCFLPFPLSLASLIT